MTGQVHQEVRDGVLVLTIDNPPVNASTQQVRAGVLTGIERLAADEGLVGAVLIGAGGSFVAGSDMGEFGGGVPEPLLPAVVTAIESCAKPVVAALDGFALGGGLELALGCDARIATAGTKLGLPEVSLGMVPGAGGTQRLPRLVGREEALSLILSGRRVLGEEAYRLGIVDDLAGDDLLDRALAQAQTMGKRRVTALPVPADDGDLDAVVARTVRGAVRPNVVAALELVRCAGTVEIGEALQQERARFDELRLSPDAAALRHIFFAERAAPRRGGVRPSPTQLRVVGVIGAGAMGAGIGAAFALTGSSVVLIDTNASQRQRGIQRVENSVHKAVSRGWLSQREAAERLAQVTVTDDLSALVQANLVIEAVIEEPAVKASVLRAAAEAAPHAVLATNTSYLRVSHLAAELDDPGRLVGMHFFNPAEIMKLIEIIPGREGHDETVAVALGAAKRLGKVAVVSADREAFIGNRIYAAYRRHAEYLLEDGATPEVVDAAMERFGFAMGPFAVADLSGLQIAQTVRRRWRDTGLLPARYVDIPDLLCEREWLGRRSGRGYYRYEDGSREPDAEVTAIIVAESVRKCIRRRSISDEEIITRLLGAMAVEGARVVREGTAAHVDDVDVAMVDGFGFPRHVGGPMWWASRQELRQEVARIVATAAHEDTASSSFEDVLTDAD